MSYTLLFIFYQCGQLLALPFILIYLLLRKFQGKAMFGSLKQRIGFIHRVQRNGKCIWIHAVSVGEVLSVQRLIKEFKQRFPDCFVYVTAGTVAGKRMAQQHLRADYVSFMPYDFLFSMLMAFNRIRPQVILAVEAEVWPNFLLLARQKKVPVYLINGRLSERKEGGIATKNILLAPLFKIYQHIYAQDAMHKEAFEKLGVATEKVSVFGNIKAFNVLDKREQMLAAVSLKKSHRPYTILLVGSVHEGEAQVYLSLFETLKKKHPLLKLVLAPRHFNWQSTLEQMVAEKNMTHYLWDNNDTKISYAQDMHSYIVDSILPSNDVLLVCTLGKLFKLYPLADIFCLGGTFVPVGGHNLLEPAVWGVPMIVGPYYQNTRAIADVLEEQNALFKVSSKHELARRIERLLQYRETREEMGVHATQWLNHEAAVVTKRLDSLFEAVGKRLQG